MRGSKLNLIPLNDCTVTISFLSMTSWRNICVTCYTFLCWCHNLIYIVAFSHHHVRIDAYHFKAKEQPHTDVWLLQPTSACFGASRSSYSIGVHSRTARSGCVGSYAQKPKNSQVLSQLLIRSGTLQLSSQKGKT